MNSDVYHVIMPYDVHEEDLKLDPHSKDQPYPAGLEWLRNNGTQAEVARILIAAVVLWEEGVGTLGECLDTAIVWERG